MLGLSKLMLLRSVVRVRELSALAMIIVTVLLLCLLIIKLVVDVANCIPRYSPLG